jgi:hypothetical protein
MPRACTRQKKDRKTNGWEEAIDPYLPRAYLVLIIFHLLLIIFHPPFARLLHDLIDSKITHQRSAVLQGEKIN